MAQARYPRSTNLGSCPSFCQPLFARLGVHCKVSVAALALAALASTADAEVTGYPWSTGFSLVSTEADGEKLSFSFQQGIEWQLFANSDWTVSPFIGLNYDRSNRPIQSWNNATKPKYGIELSNNFRFGVINWGEIRLGWQHQRYYYRDEKKLYRETERNETYVRMYMNGNWSQ